MHTINKINLVRLAACLIAAQSLLIADLFYGVTKSWAVIDYLDIVGEGSACLIALVWLLFIAFSRPAGTVSNYLIAGLSCVFIAFFQDLMDEFIILPSDIFGIAILEPSLLLVGVVVLNIGLWQWHLEQQALNKQQQRREQVFRQHQNIDGLTQLADANYLRQQLEYLLKDRHQSHALLMLDIDNFSQTNQRYGAREGDRLLAEVGEILLLNLRPKDLICRYAGDRFAILLPNSGYDAANKIAQELHLAIKHFAFKSQLSGDSVYHNISLGIAVSHRDSSDSLIDKANQDLLGNKPKWQSVA